MPPPPPYGSIKVGSYLVFYKFIFKGLTLKNKNIFFKNNIGVSQITNPIEMRKC